MALQSIPAKQIPTIGPKEERRPIPYRNLAVGAVMNVFQGKTDHDRASKFTKLLIRAPVTTLGQPMEVLKTHVRANTS